MEVEDGGWKVDEVVKFGLGKVDGEASEDGEEIEDVPGVFALGTEPRGGEVEGVEGSEWDRREEVDRVLLPRDDRGKREGFECRRQSPQEERYASQAKLLASQSDVRNLHTFEPPFERRAPHNNRAPHRRSTPRRTTQNQRGNVGRVARNVRERLCGEG